MVKYFTLKYRMMAKTDIPFKVDNDGCLSAQIVANTAEEAIEKLKDMWKGWSIETVGEPIEAEMTKEEYENG